MKPKKSEERSKMRTVYKQTIGLACSIAAFAMNAAAQTVTSSGTTGTVWNVPYISAASGTSTTLSPSPISVSGTTTVGMGTRTPQYFIDAEQTYAYPQLG
jgi:hypothetical protein